MHKIVYDMIVLIRIYWMWVEKSLLIVFVVDHSISLCEQELDVLDWIVLLAGL